MSGNGAHPDPPLGAGYEPIGLISRGNDFEVWDVWSFERGARAVIKTLRGDRSEDESARARLVREGRLLARLTHPHIVRGYEVVVSGPRPIVVMETLGGQTLSHLVLAEGPLEDADAAQVGLQLGSAVQYLHLHDHLHLDLKPSNAIAEAGRARLIDLGLAEPPGPVTPGVGTWCYLAPEQARGDRCGPAADVWGLGALLFEMLAGWPPFDDPDREIDGVVDEDIEYPQLERRARPLEDVSEAGAELAQLIGSCLEPDPADRPQLLGLMSALEGIAGIPAWERRWSAWGAR